MAGWYTGSPRPGEPGGAVIAGHVDSVQGRGVFFRLRLLKPGEQVYVRRADGTLAVFTITSVRLLPEDRLPDERGLRADARRAAAADYLRRHVRPGHRSLSEQHDRLCVADLHDSYLCLSA